MNNTGILLIHGFAGDIGEIAPLQDYLTQRGYVVKCPLLPGHGETKKELSQTTYENWITSTEQAYLELSKSCSKIVVIGFSMGGLLAVNLWNYGFPGLVTVNTPVFYWNPKIIVTNLIMDFRKYGKKYFDVSTDKSLSSMLEFQKLLTKTKSMFGNITCKTMVVQTLDDDTVHYKSADYIFNRICADKSIYKLPRGGHMIFQSESKDEACKAIEDFVRSC
ncbi:MAG TPA: alpha/beta fold hydrolase [Anaerovoracaceae bacterium]|nr:alpha/beta fold hydrolase [Anaerovoracaceae bacterium]